MGKFKKTDQYGVGMVRFIPEDIGTFNDGDIIRTKEGDHIQYIDKGAAEHLDYDIMKKHWDRVSLVLTDTEFSVGDEIINFATGEKTIATEDDMKSKRLTHSVVLGKTSIAARKIFDSGFIHIGMSMDAERISLRECTIPNHENDITGYWFRIKCPCCGEYK